MLIYSNTGMASSSSSLSAIDEIRLSLICLNPLTNKPSLNIKVMRNLVNNGTSYEIIVEALRLSEQDRVGFCAYILKKYGCMRDFIPHVLNTPERVLLFFNISPTRPYRNEIINMLCENDFSWLRRLCHSHHDLEGLRGCFYRQPEQWAIAFNTLYPDQAPVTVTHNDHLSYLIPVGKLRSSLNPSSSLLTQKKPSQTVDDFWNSGLCSTDEERPFSFMSDEELFITVPVTTDKTSPLSATEPCKNPVINKRPPPEEPEKNSSSIKSSKKKKSAPK